MHYDVDNKSSLSKFQEYLQTTEGKVRKPSVAHAIAIEEPRAWHTFAPQIFLFPWESLLQEVEIHRYLDHFRKTEAVGIDRLLTKLNRLGLALQFIKATMLQQDDSVQHHRAQRVEDALKRWKACVGIILVMLLFKNWQSPGAIVNMTVQVYRRAKVATQGEHEVLVISVHETDTQGPANVTCQGNDIQVLRTYHNQIRP